MTNPTSNYSFQMPTSTDLVTDLPADFEVFGQAVDTRLKALQPGTTLGDLAYSSATANTNTRLPIGTSGQVLAVSGGGVPSGGANMSEADVAAHNAKIRAMSGNIEGATSLVNLRDKLQNISDKIGEITFLFETNAISSKTAEKQLSPLLKQFDILSKQADALVGIEASAAFNPSSGISTPFDEPGATNITVNMGGVGDPEGVKRALIDLQNEGFYRGTGGANLLVGLP